MQSQEGEERDAILQPGRRHERLAAAGEVRRFLDPLGELGITRAGKAHPRSDDMARTRKVHDQVFQVTFGYRDGRRLYAAGLASYGGSPVRIVASLKAAGNCGQGAPARSWQRCVRYSAGAPTHQARRRSCPPICPPDASAPDCGDPQTGADLGEAFTIGCDLRGCAFFRAASTG